MPKTKQLDIMNKKNNISKLLLILTSKLRQICCYIQFQIIVYYFSRQLPVSKKTAIIFAPHQDDETFACGGIIALKRALGISVKVVFLTDGSLSIPDGVNPKKIIDIRQQEALKALDFLGVAPSEITFLNQIDGSLNQLSYEQINHIVAQLTELLECFHPEEIYVPYRHDCHPDHEATYSLVKKALSASNFKSELWQYPIWILWQNPLNSHLAPSDVANAYRVSIDSVQAQKHLAIASYHSQIATLPAGFLNRFFSPYEIFIKNLNTLDN